MRLIFLRGCAEELLTIQMFHLRVFLVTFIDFTIFEARKVICNFIVLLSSLCTNLEGH